MGDLFSAALLFKLNTSEMSINYRPSRNRKTMTSPPSPSPSVDPYSSITSQTEALGMSYGRGASHGSEEGTGAEEDDGGLTPEEMEKAAAIARTAYVSPAERKRRSHDSSSVMTPIVEPTGGSASSSSSASGGREGGGDARRRKTRRTARTRATNDDDEHHLPLRPLDRSRGSPPTRRLLRPPRSSRRPIRKSASALRYRGS